MKLRLPYGKEGYLEAAIDEARIEGIIEPNRVPIGDEGEVIRRALEHPVGSAGVRAFLAGARDVLVIVNDPTRPTLTARVLDYLEPELAGLEVSFIVATGAHRAPTPEEYVQIFSERHYARYRDRIFVHDARRSEEMVHLGTSKNGTEMRVNRRGVEADRILIISSVEPHYFAGYTGGRKSLVPGVAGFATIEANHRLALDPTAETLGLDGNPVHEDLMEAAALLPPRPLLSIQTVLDRTHNICAAYAGDLLETFTDAVQAANREYVVDLPHRYDIVVTAAAPPMDYDLYQSHKALENASLAVRPGGALVLVSSCRHGIGDRTFFDLLAASSDPESVLKAVAATYRLGFHKAARLASLAQRHRIM